MGFRDLPSKKALQEASTARLPRSEAGGSAAGDDNKVLSAFELAHETASALAMGALSETAPRLFAEPNKATLWNCRRRSFESAIVPINILFEARFKGMTHITGKFLINPLYVAGIGAANTTL